MRVSINCFENNNNNTNIYFCKPGKGNTAERIYNTNSFINEKVKKIITFVHSFTGCDTTSAFFNQGKGKLIKMLEKNTKLIDKISVFYSSNCDTQELREVGAKVVIALYGCQNVDMNLNEFRYNCYKKCTLKNNFKLEHLPPTESAITQHSYRVYLQIQQWNGNQLFPLAWGWKKSKYGLQPIFCESKLVPDNILKQIRCTCAVDCKKTCGCFKQGLRCSEFCLNCCGLNCSNSEQPCDNYVEECDDIENLDKQSVLNADNYEEFNDQFDDDCETNIEPEDCTFPAKKPRFM